MIALQIFLFVVGLAFLAYMLYAIRYNKNTLKLNRDVAVNLRADMLDIELQRAAAMSVVQEILNCKHLEVEQFSDTQIRDRIIAAVKRKCNTDNLLPLNNVSVACSVTTSAKYAYIFIDVFGLGAAYFTVPLVNLGAWYNIEGAKQ